MDFIKRGLHSLERYQHISFLLEIVLIISPEKVIMEFNRDRDEEWPPGTVKLEGQSKHAAR
jgi:hypothetical protein